MFVFDVVRVSKDGFVTPKMDAEHYDKLCCDFANPYLVEVLLLGFRSIARSLVQIKPSDSMGKGITLNGHWNSYRIVSYVDWIALQTISRGVFTF